MNFLYPLYRRLSPYLKAVARNLGLAGGHCRHSPTCSAYSREAYRRHGFLLGTWLSALRLLKCHPWGKGGYDPVP